MARHPLCSARCTDKSTGHSAAFAAAASVTWSPVQSSLAWQDAQARAEGAVTLAPTPRIGEGCCPRHPAWSFGTRVPGRACVARLSRRAFPPHEDSRSPPLRPAPGPALPSGLQASDRLLKGQHARKRPQTQKHLLRPRQGREPPTRLHRPPGPGSGQCWLLWSHTRRTQREPATSPGGRVAEGAG